MIERFFYFLKNLSKPLHSNIYEDIDRVREQRDCYISKTNILSEEIRVLNIEINEYKINLKEEKKKNVIPKDISINEFLKRRYKIIKNIAYSDKRETTESSASIYLNQMITPNVYEVLKFKKKFKKYTDNYIFMERAGDNLSKITQWVDETKRYKNKDMYIYPEETLTEMKSNVDCEDNSFVIASLKPGICGVAWGFFHKKVGKFGHAYPIFLYDGKLFIVETTGTKVVIVPFEDERYETYFIATRDKTYRIKSGVSFGKIAK